MFQRTGLVLAWITNPRQWGLIYGSLYRHGLQIRASGEITSYLAGAASQVKDLRPITSVNPEN